MLRFSGWQLTRPNRLKIRDTSSLAQNLACRFPIGFASLMPAYRLKMQRGTFEGSLAVRSIRKRPDARHFVWDGLLHPLCHSIAIENKGVSRVAQWKSG